MWCNVGLAMSGAVPSARHCIRLPDLLQIRVNYLPLLKGQYAVNISSYEDLLKAANAQAEPQRLLFVLTQAELPDEYTKDQQERFKARKGGALTPVMCVDKLASEQGSFADFVEESRQTGQEWDVVFVACLSGKSGLAPSSDDAEEPLKTMIKSVQVGSIGNFLAFNRNGELVSLTAS